jgi:hypothetical protein
MAYRVIVEDFDCILSTPLRAAAKKAYEAQKAQGKSVKVEDTYGGIYWEYDHEARRERGINIGTKMQWRRVR